MSIHLARSIARAGFRHDMIPTEESEGGLEDAKKRDSLMEVVRDSLVY